MHTLVFLPDEVLSLCVDPPKGKGEANHNAYVFVGLSILLNS
jgi:hypothetical protein